MDRYRSYGAQDDQPAQIGDNALLGVDEYNAPENIKPGNVQNAVNVDFSPQDATTRGGFVCLPELGTAPFGSTWTSQTVSATTDWRAVAYGNGVWVAVGELPTGYGTVMTSTDAVTWTVQTLVNAPRFRDVVFANGVFVAVGEVPGAPVNGVRRSTDGITWTSPATAPTGFQLNSITYGNGLFAFTALDQPNSKWYVYTSSDDGLTWTQNFLYDHFGTTSNIQYGNGKFVVTLPFLVYVFYSTDCITWSISNIQDIADPRSEEHTSELQSH